MGVPAPDREGVPKSRGSVDASRGRTIGGVNEPERLVAAVERMHSDGEPMSLATVWSVRGSSFRRPGDRLLVSSEGPVAGNISGGCLEQEVVSCAGEAIASGTALLRTFDFSPDDEAELGWGLGCNGIIEVLIEPAPGAESVAAILSEATRTRHEIAIVTILPSAGHEIEGSVGKRVVVDAGSAGSTGAALAATRRSGFGGSTGDADLDAACVEAARAALASGRGAEALELAGGNGAARAFVEVIEPPTRLLVLGAGPDAVALAAAARAIGWHVNGPDRSDRPSSDPPSVDPPSVDPPSADPASIDRRTAALVMHHNYPLDRQALGELLTSPAFYIGVLGPVRRTRRLLEDLARGEIPTLDGLAARVHAPAGLDIGAETPEEIAASIVAEILAVARSRAGGPLRDRRSPIHTGLDPNAAVGP